MKRQIELVNSCIYHVFNRSAAGSIIFNDDQEYSRIRETSLFYQFSEPENKYSRYLKIAKKKENTDDHTLECALGSRSKIVRIIAYCFMPNHYHFILKQMEDRGIEKFIGNIQNSYSRFFNTKHERRGPLWEGRFKNVLIETDEQLLHLTRYVHLNPMCSSLVKHPGKWQYSSYLEYVLPDINKKSCDFSQDLSINPANYKEFVNCQLEYQKELPKIKHLTFE